MPNACTSPKPVHALMVLLTVVFLWFAMKRDPLPAREAFQLARGIEQNGYIRPQALRPVGKPRTMKKEYLPRSMGKEQVREWVREQLEQCEATATCNYVYFKRLRKNYMASHYNKDVFEVRKGGRNHTLYEKDFKVGLDPVGEDGNNSNQELSDIYTNIREMESVPDATLFKALADKLRSNTLEAERNEALMWAFVLLHSSVLALQTLRQELEEDDTEWYKHTFARVLTGKVVDALETHDLVFSMAELIIEMRRYASPVEDTVAMNDQPLNDPVTSLDLIPVALHFAGLELEKRMKYDSLQRDDLVDALVHAGVDTARVMFGVGRPEVRVVQVDNYNDMLQKTYNGRRSLFTALKLAIPRIEQVSPVTQDLAATTYASPNTSIVTKLFNPGV